MIRLIFSFYCLMMLSQIINAVCLNSQQKAQQTISQTTLKIVQLTGQEKITHTTLQTAVSSKLSTTTKSAALLPNSNCRNTECPPNYVLDYQNCSCKCPTKYTESNGMCYCGIKQCPYEYQILDKYSCKCIFKCPPATKLVKTACVPCAITQCPENYKLNGCSCICDLKNNNCTNNFIVDYKTCACVCPEPMILIDGNCACPSDFCDDSKNFELLVRNSIDEPCQCNCKSSTTLVEDQCLPCKNSYFSCPENFYFNENLCNCYCQFYVSGCENGYQLDIDNCVCYCPQNSMIEVNGQCVCNLECDESKNFKVIYDIHTNSCNCKCKSGHYLNNDECIPCTTVCSGNFNLNEETCTCECDNISNCFGSKYKINKEKCICECAKGLIQYQNDCNCDLQCDASKNLVAVFKNYYDYEINNYCACECVSGTYMNKGECLNI